MIERNYRVIVQRSILRTLRAAATHRGNQSMAAQTAYGLTHVSPFSSLKKT